jgi:hypothetical protein
LTRPQAVSSCCNAVWMAMYNSKGQRSAFGKLSALKNAGSAAICTPVL